MVSTKRGVATPLWPVYFKFLILLLTAKTVSVTLTAENYDAMVRGRSVLLQIIVDEDCGLLCNASRPEWDGLMKDFAGSKEILVTRIEYESWWTELYDGGFAAGRFVLYGHPYALRLWYGGRSEAKLRSLALSLRAPCSQHRRDRCDAQDLERLTTYEGLESAALDTLIAATEDDVRTKVQRLDRDYEDRRFRILETLQGHFIVARDQLLIIGHQLRIIRSVARDRGLVLTGDDDVSSMFVQAAMSSTDAFFIDDHMWNRGDDASYSDDDLLETEEMLFEGDDEGYYYYYYDHLDVDDSYADFGGDSGDPLVDDDGAYDDDEEDPFYYDQYLYDEEPTLLGDLYGEESSEDDDSHRRRRRRDTLPVMADDYLYADGLPGLY